MKNYFQRARDFLKDCDPPATFAEKMSVYRQCRAGGCVVLRCMVYQSFSGFGRGYSLGVHIPGKIVGAVLDKDGRVIDPGRYVPDDARTITPNSQGMSVDEWAYGIRVGEK